MLSLNTLELFLKETLNIDSISEKAINGIQLANKGKITKIAGAVDCSVETIKKAISKKCDCLIVHHGLFWGNQFSLTGRYYEMLRLLIQHDIALIGIHLPLDLDLKYGNNAGLVKALDLDFVERFGDYQGHPILFAAKVPNSNSKKNSKKTNGTFSSFCKMYEEKIGTPIATIQGNQKKVTSIGICSGGGLFGIEEAVNYGCDTYITGDANHISYHQCKELGINLISGGHYNTETFGVKNLISLLKKEYKIPTTFLDIPTQL